jgi:hypothetical protein
MQMLASSKTIFITQVFGYHRHTTEGEVNGESQPC